MMRKIAGYLTKNRSGKDQKIAQSTHENEHIKPRKTFWRNSKQFLRVSKFSQVYFANCFRGCFSVFTRMTVGCLTGESGETDRKQTQKGADKNTESEYLNALRVLFFFYGSSLFPETRRKHQQNAEQFQTPYQHKERRQPFSCIRQRIP